MRAALLLALSTLALPANAAELLDTVQSAPAEAPGTATELATKARLCVTKLVRNDAFQIRDSARVGVMSPAGATDGDSATIPGGDVVTTFDADAGLVVAQSRIVQSGLMGRQSLQSTITIETKDGRFRITHSAIARAFDDTGYGANDGYKPVPIGAMSGHAKIRKALEELSGSIIACVQQPADNW